MRTPWNVLFLLAVLIVSQRVDAAAPQLGAAVDAVVQKLPLLTAAIGEIRMIRLPVSYRDGKIVESRLERLKTGVDRLQRLAPILKKAPTIGAVALFKDAAEALLVDELAPVSWTG